MQKNYFVVTELFDIDVNYFDGKKSAHYNQVLVVPKFVISGTLCIITVNVWFFKEFFVYFK